MKKGLFLLVLMTAILSGMPAWAKDDKAVAPATQKEEMMKTDGAHEEDKMIGDEHGTTHEEDSYSEESKESHDDHGHQE